MVSFPFESFVLPFLLGEESGASSQGHFSWITTSLVDEVVVLDPYFSFFSLTFLASFDKLILFDITFFISFLMVPMYSTDSWGLSL